MNAQTTQEERVIGRVREGRDELLALLAELVACDTTSREAGDPARDEDKLQRILAKRLCDIGAEVDLWEPEPTGTGNRCVPDNLDFIGRPQLIATRTGRGGGRSLLLNGHIDAVPTGDCASWQSDPFLLDVRDGYAYGRGAADMKGGIAAMLFAVECLAREGAQLKGDILFATNTDEESSGAGGYALVDRGVKADGGIVAEPTGFDVWTACRGTWMPVITVEGRAAHAEMPQSHWSTGGGVNAIEKLQVVLQAIATLRAEWARRPDHQHPLLAPGDIVPTKVRAGEWGVTYPPTCDLTCDVTYLPGHVGENDNGRAVEQEVKRWVEAAAAADPWLTEHPLKWRQLCDTVPAEVSPNHPLVGLLLEAQTRFGRGGCIAGLNSWHDAATLTRFGTPTVSFGPGGIDTAHCLDERTPVADLVDFAGIVAVTALRFLGA